MSMIWCVDRARFLLEVYEPSQFVCRPNMIQSSIVSLRGFPKYFMIDPKTHATHGERIEYFDMLPPKNWFIVGLCYLRWPLSFGFVRAIVRHFLKYCEAVDFTPGFRFLY